MKKNVLRMIIAIVILLAVWNVLAFAIPFDHTPVFWIGYGCGMLAIFAQLPLMLYSFGAGKNLRSKLYGFPIARVSVVYLAVQLILGLLAMALGALIPAWPVVIVEVLFIAAIAAGLLATTAMRDEIQRQDTVLKANVGRMRALQSKTHALVGLTEDQKLLPALKQLAENLRYSDPVSSAATAETESSLAACVDDLEKALIDGELDGAFVLCKKAEAVLIERNRLCKLNKQQ